MIDEDMEALRKISTTSSCPTEASDFERKLCQLYFPFLYSNLLTKLEFANSTYVDTRRRRPPLWMSCRLSLSLMCLAATFAFFLMRLNLSFAIVCMISNDNYSNQTVNDDFNQSEEINVQVKRFD